MSNLSDATRKSDNTHHKMPPWFDNFKMHVLRDPKQKAIISGMKNCSENMIDYLESIQDDLKNGREKLKMWIEIIIARIDDNLTAIIIFQEFIHPLRTLVEENRDEKIDDLEKTLEEKLKEHNKWFSDETKRILQFLSQTYENNREE